MKVKEIVLGKRYAFYLVTPAWRQSPKTSPVKHGDCIDISGNTVIFDCDEMVLSPAGKIKKAQQPDQLVGNSLYEPGKQLYRIPAHRVICLSDEYAPPVPDGRIDAPAVHRAGGHTFTSERMAGVAG